MDDFDKHTVKGMIIIFMVCVMIICVTVVLSVFMMSEKDTDDSYEAPTVEDDDSYELPFELRATHRRSDYYDEHNIVIRLVIINRCPFNLDVNVSFTLVSDYYTAKMKPNSSYNPSCSVNYSVDVDNDMNRIMQVYIPIPKYFPEGYNVTTSCKYVPVMTGVDILEVE